MSRNYKVQTRFLFHTNIKIKIPEEYYSETVFDELYGILEDVNEKYNSYSENSFIDRINKNSGNFVEVNEEMIEILERVVHFSDMMNGEYDITIMPLIKLWGFYKKSDIRIPEKKEIEDLVEKSNFNYNLLKKLIEHCIENSSKDTYQVYYNTLLSLVEKKNYEQLKSELETIDKDELKEISDNVNIIKDKLKYRAEGEDFIHYTSLNTLKFLLYKIDDKDNYPRLRLSNARQMNDPNEGYTFLNLIGIKKEELPQTDYDTSPFFFASMTQTGNGQNLDDSLPMWKEYAEESRGAFLQYDKKYLQKIIEHDSLEFVRIFYLNSTREEDSDIIKKLNELKKVVQELKDRHTKESESIKTTIIKNLAKISYLFKVSDYEYESEYRILINFDDSEIERRLNPKLITEDRIEIEELRVLSGGIGLSENEKSGYKDFRKYIHLESQEDGRYALFVYINLLPLKYSKVILGPKVTDADYIAPYLKLANPDIEIESSKIPYR